jgi:hypothetical protein
LVIRPAFAQIIERRDRFLRVAAAELGARLAESIDRVVAHRQRENVLVVIFRLGELPQFRTLFGKRRAIGDGVGDFELLGERAVTLRWIERIDHVPARLLALGATEPFGRELHQHISKRAEAGDKQDDVSDFIPRIDVG